MKNYWNEMRIEKEMLQETLMKEGSAYKELLKKSRELEDRFMNGVTNEQWQMYDDMSILLIEANAIYADALFKLGFELGLEQADRSDMSDRSNMFDKSDK